MKCIERPGLYLDRQGHFWKTVPPDPGCIEKAIVLSHPCASFVAWPFDFFGGSVEIVGLLFHRNTGGCIALKRIDEHRSVCIECGTLSAITVAVYGWLQ
jgi:hypothetical protein